MSDGVFLGADPGGIGNFGVALIRVAEGRCVSTEASCVRSVDGAIQWYGEKLSGEEPAGIGIDCILFWRTGDAGKRWVDTRLKARYRSFANSVKTINELYGAMCVQGITLAHSARRMWPTIEINETHPKLLRAALTETAPLWAGEMQRENVHEADAVVAAISAWKGPDWGYDALTDETREGEILSSPVILPIPDVHYWWPSKLTL